MALPSDAILTRKLHELESRLREAFVFPRRPPTEEEEEWAAPPGYAPPSDDEIGRRFEFLKNLLSAEMESHQGSKPAHLYHIAERLGYLRWPQTLDSASACSCTSSCFNEEKDDEGTPEPPVSENPQPIEPIISQGWRMHCHGIHAGVVTLLATAAAAAMVLLVVSNFSDAERSILLVPT
ncbi:unnamed protein product [Spirodela intermedia]|uniref:DUF7610 domain-containing protein n=1 Tax=Spirodela intermedia TaxID=51605 RepID=A0A7I8IEH4_SPIIN|nr:unnamed protein product [Spirodela intermedia]CAA6656186.1 unnamed protein product [Spirodela intermedia]